MEVRQMYGYDVDKVSAEHGLECKDPSLAIQEMAEDADINVIVRRFGLTGVMPQRSSVPIVVNGDFQEITTLQEAMDIMNQAERSFMEMPAEVRSRFGNDPAKFVDFCSDPTNLDNVRDMIKMGLAVERVVPPEVIQKVEVINNIPPKPVDGGSK